MHRPPSAFLAIRVFLFILCSFDFEIVDCWFNLLDCPVWNWFAWGNKCQFWKCQGLDNSNTCYQCQISLAPNVDCRFNLLIMGVNFFCLCPLDYMKNNGALRACLAIKKPNGLLSQSLSFPIQSLWLFSLFIFGPEVFANTDRSLIKCFTDLFPSITAIAGVIRKLNQFCFFLFDCYPFNIRISINGHSYYLNSEYE